MRGFAQEPRVKSKRDLTVACLPESRSMRLEGLEQVVQVIFSISTGGPGGRAPKNQPLHQLRKNLMSQRNAGGWRRN